MRTLLRLGTVLTVFLGVSFVQLPMSQAMEVPETLADRQPVGAGPVETEFPIDYLGVLWDTKGALDEHADEEAGEHGAVRFRVDGAWTAWQPLTEDGAQADGQWGSALVSADDAEAYQVRGVPADAIAPRAVAINTTDGPLVEVGRRPAGTANAIDTCLSRTEWGADERLRFDATGEEVWPAEFYPAQTMTVHHTATKNNDDTPAATVRGIYRYHAVERGWGDIGYHYLIDEQGAVYEGRWSGEASGGCGSVGGGADFAHDGNDGLVTAGHTGGYNSGNMGAAVLGTFTTTADPTPTGAAVGALENLLAEFATRHGLDPKALVTYVNPADPGARKTVDMISGHRDWVSTACPGGNLYAMLPAIRDSVAARMASADAPQGSTDALPTVSVTSPVDGATVSGSVPVTATASDEGGGVTQVAFAVDSTVLATDVDGADGWSVPWDTTTVVDGLHTLTATASDTAGQSASHTVTVTVDNPLTVSGVSPNSGRQNTTVQVTITGSGFASVATVDLRGGTGTQPQVSGVSVVDGSTIMATFKIGKTSGPRQDRPWDVVVTVNGSSTALTDGFTVR